MNLPKIIFKKGLWYKKEPNNSYWCNTRFYRETYICWVRLFIRYCNDIFITTETIRISRHRYLGNVDYLLLIHLLIGSIPVFILDSIFSTKIPVKPFQIFLAIIIGVSGLKLVITY